jgi:hypothetical protein
VTYTDGHHKPNIKAQQLLVNAAAGFGNPMPVCKTENKSSQLSVLQTAICKRQISCDVRFIVPVHNILHKNTKIYSI